MQVGGFGIGWRRPHHAELLRTDDPPDFLELIVENHLFQGGFRRRELDAIRERYPLVAHGVSASIGGPEAFDVAQIGALEALLGHLDLSDYSDHLCWSRDGRQDHLDLLPVPFTHASVEWCAARTRELSGRLARPVLLENVTTYAVMPGSELDAATFLVGVLDASDATLLLDLNNLYVDSLNRGFDAGAELLRLPLERVRRVHLAGHSLDPEGLWLDDHASAVAEPVWSLYATLVRKIGPVPTVIEWDAKLPTLDVVLAELARARSVSASAAAEALPRSAS
jgi:uncharacterized protein